MHRPRRTAALGLLAATALSSVAAAGFTSGDVYLVSASLPGPGGTAIPGIFRYRPSDGSSGLWLNLTNGPFGIGAALPILGSTYDPFRDRLLLPILGGTKVGVVDDAGNQSTIDLPSITATFLAPRGDGLVYLVGAHHVYYLDAGDVPHELLDGSLQPIDLAAFGLASYSSTIYDAPSGSLIVAGPSAGGTRFARLPFDASGTHLAGRITAATVDLVPGQVEAAAGMSAGPGGSLFVTLDINANGTFTLLQTVNPVTFASAGFASTSGFFNAALTTGTWLPASGTGLVLDTFDDIIRAYPPGGSGVGTSVASGASSAGGSAELARMVAIGATINQAPSVAGDLDGDSHVSAADLAILLGAWGSCSNCADCPADLDGDCTVSAADLAILLGNWG